MACFRGLACVLFGTYEGEGLCSQNYGCLLSGHYLLQQGLWLRKPLSIVFGQAGFVRMEEVISLGAIWVLVCHLAYVAEFGKTFT